MKIDKLLQEIHTDGSALDYAYNARNILSNITADAPPPVAEYTYNARNQIAAMRWGP